MRHRRSISCALASFALASATAVPVARGAPFNAALVSGHAKFVAFLDLDRARETAVGQRLLKFVTDDPGYVELERNLSNAVGLVPALDISDITLWSDVHGQEHKTVIVLRFGIDTKALRDLTAFLPELTQDGYKKHETYSWRDDKKPGTRANGCIFDSRTFLFSHDPDTLRRAIDVLEDERESLAKPADAAHVAQPSEGGVWAFASAIDVANANVEAKLNPVVSRMADATIEVSDRSADGTTLARLSGHAIDDASGPRLLTMARGAQAIALLTLPTAQPTTTPAEVATPESRLAEAKARVAAMLPELLDRLDITGEGRQLSFDLSLSNPRALELIEALATLHEAQLDVDGLP